MLTQAECFMSKYIALSPCFQQFLVQFKCHFKNHQLFSNWKSPGMQSQKTCIHKMISSQKWHLKETRRGSQYLTIPALYSLQPYMLQRGKKYYLYILYLCEFDIKPNFCLLFTEKLKLYSGIIDLETEYHTPPVAERGQQTLALQQFLFHPAMILLHNTVV